MLPPLSYEDGKTSSARKPEVGGGGKHSAEVSHGLQVWLALTAELAGAW